MKGQENGTVVNSKRAGGGNGAKKSSPKRAFAKFFLITFVCCVVGMSAALGAWDTLLNQKPMEKAAASDYQIPEPVGQTEEKLNILIPGSGAFLTDPVFKDSKRVNILLFGNTINSSKAKGLTDTIMLASIDPDLEKMDVISVPRDTYYERKGYAYGGFLKINSVMESEGVRAACEAVHNVLGGVPINYYAVVDYDGVAKIVDSIGGVPVDIPFNMYYTDRKQGLYIDLKAGDDQTLDGEHAVQFLRYRKGYGNGDIGRVDAQQQFIKAAIKKSLGLNLPNVARTVVENVDSDIDIRAMLYLVSHVSGMGSDDLKSHMLPGVPETTNVGSFWIAADDYEVTKMMKEVYTGEVMTTGGAISSSAISSSAVSPSAAGAPEE